MRRALTLLAVLLASTLVLAQVPLSPINPRIFLTTEAVCTITISTGANVAATIASAAAGSVVCLNGGSYGLVTLGAFTKSPRVTVRSTTGQGATIALQTTAGANGVIFSSLTIANMDIADSATRNITVQRSAFGTSQLDINTTNFNNNNILIDGNTFGAFNAGGGKEGRLSVTWGGGPGTVAAGVTISHNTFGPNGCSDGINIGSYGVVVGPGNLFTGIVQGACGPHVDSIQGYGQSHTLVTGNFFTGNSVDLGFYDGGTSEVVTNNVIIGGDQSAQMGTIANALFEHNTVSGATISYNGKPENGPSTNLLLRNNLFINSASVSLNQNGTPACTSCTVTNNQFTTGGSGANILNGAPTFLGGSSPSTWAGWLLTAASIGKSAGTDGADMGTLLYGQ